MALLQRIYNFFSEPPVDPAIANLYVACVAAARNPEFYQRLGVPDTIDGRFDLLLLHVYLVIRRLGNEAEARQQLFDLMYADMDRSLREMGVGDMSIGKKMKPMLAAFYGRAKVYEKALSKTDENLSLVLRRNLYDKVEPTPDQLQGMENYVRRSWTQLDKQALNHLLGGKVEFATFHS